MTTARNGAREGSPTVAARRSLAGFLTARIEEDERHFRRDFPDDDSPGTWLAWGLAECEAKRRIIGIHAPATLVLDLLRCNWCHEDTARSIHEQYPCETLRALAAVYADHPDYRQEWRS